MCFTFSYAGVGLRLIIICLHDIRTLEKKKEFNRRMSHRSIKLSEKQRIITNARFN